MTSTIWNMLLVIAAVLILPLIPSLLIYKVLPDQRIFVKGTFAGVQLNATGAFAGYFVLMLAAMLMEGRLSEDPRFWPTYDTWTIEGNLRLSDPRDSASQATVSVVPSILEMHGNGNNAHFRVVAPIRAIDAGSAAIQVNRPPYTTISVPVGSNAGRDPVTNTEYSLVRDQLRRVITIKNTLELQKMESPYNPNVIYVPKIIP